MTPPIDAERRLRQWAELTSLSLSLLEGGLRATYPGLSDEAIHAKLIDRLFQARALRWPTE
ncbi:MAG: hypothetical protein ABIO65_13195 [Nitrospiria bacterium]